MNAGLITTEEAANILAEESEKFAAQQEVPQSSETYLRSIVEAMVNTFRGFTAERPITTIEALILGGEMMKFFGIDDPVGIRILGFSELCFPEGKDQFTTVPWEVWEETKRFAAAQLEQNGEGMLASHRSHMIDVCEGKVPFGLAIAEKTFIPMGDESVKA